jgi:hypothetical protein
MLRLLRGVEERLRYCREQRNLRCGYSFHKYAGSAARSSGSGTRSKCTPSVEATGGTTPGGALTWTRLRNSMV